MQVGLQALASQEAAFLYEITLKDLGPEGRSALQDALRLNLSTLSGSEQSLPTGIREIQSLLTTTRKQGYSLKLNILGIYNFASVSDLTLKGTVLSDPSSGEIVITDSGPPPWRPWRKHWQTKVNYEHSSRGSRWWRRRFERRPGACRARL
jgi:hypothetical protein